MLVRLGRVDGNPAGAVDPELGPAVVTLHFAAPARVGDREAHDESRRNLLRPRHADEQRVKVGAVAEAVRARVRDVATAPTRAFLRVLHVVEHRAIELLARGQAIRRARERRGRHVGGRPGQRHQRVGLQRARVRRVLERGHLRVVEALDRPHARLHAERGGTQALAPHAEVRHRVARLRIRADRMRDGGGDLFDRDALRMRRLRQRNPEVDLLRAVGDRRDLRRVREHERALVRSFLHDELRVRVGAEPISDRTADREQRREYGEPDGSASNP
jgi:hypothetical protein